jgi:hypothetical protein
MQDALMTEAAAAYDDLKMTIPMGLTRVILECDNSVLVNDLNSSTLDRSVIAGFCHDIKSFLGLFCFFKVCFTHMAIEKQIQ